MARNPKKGINILDRACPAALRMLPSETGLLLWGTDDAKRIQVESKRR